jgi:predicted Rdx family selenoprotein
VPENTTKNVAIWEQIRDKVEPSIAAWVDQITKSIHADKSLGRFRTTRPIPRQFYEILDGRANAWVSEVHKLCLDAQNCPNDAETDDFIRAVFDFVIEPFIDEQLPDLLLRAAGFRDMERQLTKRGEVELKAYLPERCASLTVTASVCQQVQEKVRSRWMQALRGRKTSSVAVDTAPVAESERTQEFKFSSDGRSLNWNGKQHALTPQQAQIIQVLHEHYESGTPDVGDQYILVELGTSNSRLRDTFRDCPLWNTLIVSKKKGTHRLDPENGS